MFFGLRWWEDIDIKRWWDVGTAWYLATNIMINVCGLNVNIMDLINIIFGIEQIWIIFEIWKFLDVSFLFSKITKYRKFKSLC